MNKGIIIASAAAGILTMVIIKIIAQRQQNKKIEKSVSGMCERLLKDAHEREICR
jgi:hypothetical protein